MGIVSHRFYICEITKLKSNTYETKINKGTY